MNELTLAEWRQIELALVARIVRISKTPPRKQGSHHDFLLATSHEAMRKVVAITAAMVSK